MLSNAIDGNSSVRDNLRAKAFSPVHQRATALRTTRLLPLCSHPNTVLAVVNEAKLRVNERLRKKLGEKGKLKEKKKEKKRARGGNEL